MSQVTQVQTQKVNPSKVQPQQGVISLDAEEVKPSRSIQEFLQSAERIKEIAEKHEKYIARLKEIRDFKQVVLDGKVGELTITSKTGKPITFSHYHVIAEFISERLAEGEKELSDLETEMKRFSI
jgi:hypothetical protein